MPSNAKNTRTGKLQEEQTVYRPRVLLIVIFTTLLASFAAYAVGLAAPVVATLGVTCFCALGWMLQPIALPAISLAPLALLPLLGVLPHQEVAQAYGHSLVLLLLCGFILSRAIEEAGAHERLARFMVRILSRNGETGPRRLLLGFMLASAFASMWISNTATLLICLPVIVAATAQHPALRLRVLLGSAWAASIGGMATPIGTPPNLVFMAQYDQLGLGAWSFVDWMRLSLPVVVLLLPLGFWLLARELPRGLRLKPPAARPWSAAEVRVLAIFSLVALGWITRMEPWGGWSQLFDLGVAGDTSVAALGVVLLFCVPRGQSENNVSRLQPLLSWRAAAEIPWGILLLFGGGLALAAAFKSSGLSLLLGQQLGLLTHLPPFWLMLSLCVTVTFLTEVTSNTATTALLLPILASAAEAAGLSPATLMFPATLSASCAFMMPAATAPNAIIFATGEVTVPFMARRGLWLNLLAAPIIAGLCAYFLS